MVYHLAAESLPHDGTVHTLCGRIAQAPRVLALLWILTPEQLPAHERLCKICIRKDHDLTMQLLREVIAHPDILPPLRRRMGEE